MPRTNVDMLVLVLLTLVTEGLAFTASLSKSKAGDITPRERITLTCSFPDLDYATFFYLTLKQEGTPIYKYKASDENLQGPTAGHEHMFDLPNTALAADRKSATWTLILNNCDSRHGVYPPEPHKFDCTVYDKEKDEAEDSTTIQVKEITNIAVCLGSDCVQKGEHQRTIYVAPGSNLTVTASIWNALSMPELVVTSTPSILESMKKPGVPFNPDNCTYSAVQHAAFTIKNSTEVAFSCTTNVDGYDCPTLIVSSKPEPEATKSPLSEAGARAGLISGIVILAVIIVVIVIIVIFIIKRRLNTGSASPKRKESPKHENIIYKPAQKNQEPAQVNV